MYQIIRKHYLYMLLESSVAKRGTPWASSDKFDIIIRDFLDPCKKSEIKYKKH